MKLPIPTGGTLPRRPAPSDTARLATHLLREMRQAAGLTQTTCARQAGISHSMLAQVETGRRHSSRELVARLVTVCRAPPLLAARLTLAWGYVPEASLPLVGRALLHNDPALTAAQATAIGDLLAGVYAAATAGGTEGTPREGQSRLLTKRPERTRSRLPRIGSFGD